MTVLSEPDAPTVTSTLPGTVRAGEPVQFTVAITPGRALGPDACIVLARNWPADWGGPQWHYPEAANHVSVSADDTPVALTAGLEPSLHPYDHALTLTFTDGLPATQTVDVGFGGTPGFEAQTFIETPCRMRVLTREAGAEEWSVLGEAATEVIGSSAARLVATAPSVVRPGESFRVHLRIEDMWGNPASNLDTEVTLAETVTARIIGTDGAFAWVDLTLDTEGVHRLEAVASELGFATVSNPVRCTTEADRQIYWGDIHAQSSIGCGAQSVEDYFLFARDFAAADFASHQANCYMVSTPEWAETETVTEALNADGRYVTLLGYEWSGVTNLGGDHNVYFPGRTGDIRRCGHFMLDDLSDADTDLPHVTDLHDHVRGEDMLLAVHVGGRTTDLQWHEPTTERLLEVHSTHATSEWFLHEALRRGYRLGVTGGSDGVDGRPGASHPGRKSVRNLPGGLAAVRMPALTRDNLWSALKARATYGTTGERILVDFALGAARYGDDFTVEGIPAFAIDVQGTGPLRSVEVFRGTEPVFAAPLAPADARPSDTVRVRWRGVTAAGNWRKARMAWTGHIAIEGGTFAEARDFIVDTPAEGIAARADTRIEFSTITAGNWNAIDVDVVAGPDAVLTFDCGEMRFTVPFAALEAGPAEQAHGMESAYGGFGQGPWRMVQIERLPRAPVPAGWTGVFADAAAPPGEHAYWLRAEQMDGAMAWSSPIFATVAP